MNGFKPYDQRKAKDLGRKGGLWVVKIRSSSQTIAKEEEEGGGEFDFGSKGGVMRDGFKEWLQMG